MIEGQTASTRRARPTRRALLLRQFLAIILTPIALLAGAVSSVQADVNYVYDPVGRLVAVYDPSGNAAVYSYDAVGNLLAIANYPANTPAAFYMSSSNAQPGSDVTIYGTDLCSNPSVTFNGAAAAVVSSSGTQIVVAVPSGASAGPVVVSCGSSNLNAGAFSSGYAPTINAFSPAIGAPGTAVTISGTNLQSAEVAFNGSAALTTATNNASATAIVPGNAASGPLSVSNQYGQSSSAASFTVLPSGTIYGGQLSTDGTPAPPVNFEFGNQQALFTFDGAADEQVLVSFDDPQLDCTSSAIIQAPDGSAVASVGDVCYSIAYAGITLPATGTYSVFVNSGWNPGSISAAVQDVAQFPSASISSGPINVTVPVGQATAVTFSGNAGDQISLSALFASSAVHPDIGIVAPGGSRLGSAQPYPSTPGEYFDAFTLPSTGTYLIVCASSQNDMALNRTENVSLQIFNAPPIVVDATVGGPSVTLTPTAPGQMAYVNFAGTAGEQVSINFVTTGYFPDILLLYPDGNFGWTWPQGASDGSGDDVTTGAPRPLPANGTYQFAIDFQGGTAAASVTLYDASPLTGNIAVGGAPVTISNNPGQTDALSVTANQSQLFSLLVTQSTYPVFDWNIFEGGEVSEGTVYGQDASRGPITYDSMGTILDATATVGAGSATLQLYDATPISGSIAIGGSAVPISANPNQVVQLAFNGAAGEQIDAEVSNSTFANGYISVLAPDGTTISSDALSGADTLLSVHSLPATGSYTIEVSGEPYPGTANVRVYDVPAMNLPITVGGSPVYVDVTSPGQTVNLTFDGVAGQWVSASFTNSTLSPCASVSLVNPSGGEEGYSYLCGGGDNRVLDATQLSMTGTYTISIQSWSGSIGSFDAQAYSITPVTGPIAVDGAPVETSSTTPGQVFQYSFSGSAGQRIGLAGTNFSSTGDCTPWVEINDPNGNYIDGTSLDFLDFPDGTASLWNGSDVLPSDGAYTIYYETDCLSATADLQVYNSPLKTGSVAVNGDPVTTTSDLPGQWTQLTFSGTSGESITLNIANSTYQDCVYVEIDDPNGDYFDSDYTCNASDAYHVSTLSSSGTYSVVVEPYGATGSVDISLTSP